MNTYNYNFFFLLSLVLQFICKCNSIWGSVTFVVRVKQVLLSPEWHGIFYLFYSLNREMCIIADVITQLWGWGGFFSTNFCLRQYENMRHILCYNMPLKFCSVFTADFFCTELVFSVYVIIVSLWWFAIHLLFCKNKHC